jgi:cytochrome P450
LRLLILEYHLPLFLFETLFLFPCLSIVQKCGELTEENMSQCVLEMLIAESDTVSVMVYFMLFLTKRHPDVEEEIRKEIQTAVGKNLSNKL